MRTVPLTLDQANALVLKFHRHHKPARGHRFSIGAERAGELIGASIVGRPVARKTNQYDIAEVIRLVTDGKKNACSFLYGACARIAKEMGFAKIQTFILKDEPGTSLIAAGWMFEGMTDSKPEKWHSRSGRRSDQPSESKQKWSKMLSPKGTK